MPTYQHNQGKTGLHQREQKSASHSFCMNHFGKYSGEIFVNSFNSTDFTFVKNNNVEVSQSISK